MTKVLDVMMKLANCTDISQLPYATPYIDFEADPKYAKKVTCDVVDGYFVLKFKIDLILSMNLPAILKKK